MIPTQCTYSGIGSVTTSAAIKDDLARRLQTRFFWLRKRYKNCNKCFRRKESEDRKNAWKAFVESIRSKLTVKQVVDGVRSGGDLTFDYVLLVLTAE